MPTYVFDPFVMNDRRGGIDSNVIIQCEHAKRGCRYLGLRAFKLSASREFVCCSCRIQYDNLKNYCLLSILSNSRCMCRGLVTAELVTL